MKTTVLTMLILVVILTGACTDIESQVEASVEAKLATEVARLNADISPGTQFKKFCIGSTKDQVRSIQGEPKSVLEIGTGAGSAERWMYESFSGISMVMFSNDTGLVMNWQDDENKMRVTTVPELCVSNPE